MKAIQFNSANVIKSAIKCMNFEMDAATSISKGMMSVRFNRMLLKPMLQAQEFQSDIMECSLIWIWKRWRGEDLKKNGLSAL